MALRVPQVPCVQLRGWKLLWKLILDPRTRESPPPRSGERGSWGAGSGCGSGAKPHDPGHDGSCDGQGLLQVNAPVVLQGLVLPRGGAPAMSPGGREAGGQDPGGLHRLLAGNLQVGGGRLALLHPGLKRVPRRELGQDLLQHDGEAQVAALAAPGRLDRGKPGGVGLGFQVVGPDPGGFLFFARPRRTERPQDPARRERRMRWPTNVAEARSGGPSGQRQDPFQDRVHLTHAVFREAPRG